MTVIILGNSNYNNFASSQTLQVFFGVMIGAFSLGHAAPNLQNIATARGAAYVVWGVIDRVSE